MASLRRIGLVGLVIFGAYIVYLLLPWHDVAAGLSVTNSVTADVALLATVIAAAVVSLWMTFAGEQLKKEERLLLIVLLSGGSFFSWYWSGAFAGKVMFSPGWADAHPTVATNLILGADFLLVTGLILGVAAVIVAVRKRKNTIIQHESGTRKLNN